MNENPEHVSVEETELLETERDDAPEGEFIEQPAKVMRVGSMLRQLLDELKEVTLDEGSRDRMREIQVMWVVAGYLYQMLLFEVSV